MRKFFVLVSIILVIIFSLFSVVLATSGTQLHQLESADFVKWADYIQSGEVPDSDKILDVSSDTGSYVFWHFVETSKSGAIATLKFIDELGKSYEYTLQPYKMGMHYGIITPVDFILDEAWLSVIVNGNFNLSHTVLFKLHETTTTAEETTGQTTTTQATTSQITEIETTAEVTTTIEKTDSSTTQQRSTTTSGNITTTTTTTGEDYPETGENNNGIIIGVILLVLSVSLYAIIHKKVGINNA